MAEFVSKATPTNGVIKSAHDDEKRTFYPANDYWMNLVWPSAAKKYWVNNGGNLEEGSTAQKDAVDAAEGDVYAKSGALGNIRKGEKAIANWKVDNGIDSMSSADRKFIEKKLEDVFNSIYAGSLPTASDLLINDTNASGALTQTLIDNLKTQITNI